MTDPSRPALRLVPDGSGTDASDPGGSDPGRSVDDAVRDAVQAGPATGRRAPTRGPGALVAEIDAEVARLRTHAGGRLRSRWESVRRLADAGDLSRLAAHAASLHEAADTVRRQHTETAEDLGPLWDTWAGPAAEAVQDRVSALARSAHALVVELESTAGRLADDHDEIVEALEILADELSRRPPRRPAELVAACDRAAAAASAAWEDARRVVAGGGVSGFGPRSL